MVSFTVLTVILSSWITNKIVSFCFKYIWKRFKTKTDNLIGYPRTEYHCKNCKGHHGHLFEDGPKPTGKRYCNNGTCLVFKPKE